MSRRLPRGKWLALLCLVPFALFFTAFQIAPLLWVAVHSLITPDGWGLGNFSKLFASRFYLQAVQHSLEIAFYSSVLGLLIALFGSYSLRQIDSRLRDLVMAFANMSSNFAGVPLAFAFIILLGFNGALTLLLKQAGLIEDFNLYSRNGLPAAQLSVAGNQPDRRDVFARAWAGADGCQGRTAHRLGLARRADGVPAA